MTSYIRSFTSETFKSLQIRNYRLYFIGQGISLCGNWMQTVALGWLVLLMTGSGTQLGAVLAVHYMPFLSPFSGIIVDRFNKRRILYVTQTALFLCALVMSVLVFSETIETWMLYVFGFLTGVFNSIDHPTRQTFVHEMVGPDNLRNAVALGSTEANLARAIGPLIAGTLIAGIGIAFCFFINALTFLGVIAILGRMRMSELHVERRETKGANDVLSGFRYVASVPVLASILIAISVIGTFSYEFQTTLPLFAKDTFGGDAATYAMLFSAMGVGSVIGGLFAASRKQVVMREFIVSAFFFGLSICATALMPTLTLAMLGMVFVGFFSINMASVGNTILQLTSAPHMRGRVMSLWASANFGSTLIGSPIVGYIGQHASPRWAIGVGGIAAVFAAIYASVSASGWGTLLSVPAFFQIRREEVTSENTKII